MLKIHPTSSLTYYFDRSFSGKWWKQILWLTAAVLITFLFFWGISLIMFPNPEDFEVIGQEEPEGRMMLLFRLFYDPGSIEHLTARARNFGVVVVLVGLVLFMGMLISVISNILERHIQRYMDGSFEYSFNDHHVILGYNKTVPGLIHTICLNLDREDKKEEGRGIGKKAILLFSSKPSDNIRKELESQLSISEVERVVIKNGNRNSEDSLKGLSLEKASEVWVIGEENEYDHDSLNIDCVAKIVKLCEGYNRFKKIANIINNNKKIAEQNKKLPKEQQKEENPIPYYYPEKLDIQVSFNRQSAFRAFQSTDISKEWRKYINFRAYNFCDDWARYVFVKRGGLINKNGEETTYKFPAIENPSGNKRIEIDSSSHVHLIVFGMTDMGLAMGTRVAHLVHLPNFTKDNSLKTIVSFVDIEADRKMEDFRNRYQYLFEIQSTLYKDFSGDNIIEKTLPPTLFKGEDTDFLDIQFEFIKANANDSRLKNYITECANNQNDILSIAICFNDPDYNLQIGQNLPFDVYFPAEGNNPVPVYIRQFTNGMMIDELRSSKKFEHLYPFGMHNESHVLSEEDEIKAMRVNFTYDQCHDDNYEIKKDEQGFIVSADYTKEFEMKSSWCKLQTSLQWSNLYCLDNFEMRRRLMGDKSGKLKDKYKDIKEDTDMRILSEVEHNRWNVEKLLMGYRKPTEEELRLILSDKKKKKEYKENKFVHHDLQSYAKLKEIDPGAIKYDTIIMANIEGIVGE